MEIYRADVLVETKNGIVKNIGRTSFVHPEIKWDGKGIKWLDESKYIKKRTVA